MSHRGKQAIANQQSALNRARSVVSGVSNSSHAKGPRIQASADGLSADVYLYDQIGAWFGIDAQQFTKDLQAVTAPTINLHVNSPGGDVFDGTAIYNALQQHPSKVVTYVDGVAASIASIIALAGDEVVMGEGAYFMIHNAWGLAIGNAAELRQTADVLEKISGQLAGIYARQTGMSLADAQTAMDAETWYTAQEAVDAGFATSVALPPDEEAQAARDALASFDFSVFSRTPEPLKVAASAARPGARQKAAPQTIREFEDFLRDEGGFSHAAAKAIAAAGFKRSTDPRDEDDARALLESIQRTASLLQR